MCNSDGSMEKVIPVIVTDSYICTSDDMNNNIGGMEDKNGSGYLKMCPRCKQYTLLSKCH